MLHVYYLKNYLYHRTRVPVPLVHMVPVVATNTYHGTHTYNVMSLPYMEGGGKSSKGLLWHSSSICSFAVNSAEPPDSWYVRLRIERFRPQRVGVIIFHLHKSSWRLEPTSSWTPDGGRMVPFGTMVLEYTCTDGTRVPWYQWYHWVRTYL